VPSLTESEWSTWKEMKSLKRPARWYIALRYTDMLIRGKALDHLESLLQNRELACRKDKDFLCGLGAQLDQAINTEGLSPNDRVVQILDEFLVQQGKTSKHPRVQEWVRLVTGTTGQPNWAKPGRLLPRLHFGPREYGTTVGCQKTQPDTDRGELLGEAWKTCLEAQVFYADQAIRDRYTHSKLELLKIERLSGSALSMDRCYINLAILQDDTEGRKAEEDDGNTPSPFSLLRRLNVWEPPKSGRISLSDLFGKSQGASNAGTCGDDPLNRSSVTGMDSPMLSSAAFWPIFVYSLVCSQHLTAIL